MLLSRLHSLSLKFPPPSSSSSNRNPRIRSKLPKFSTHFDPFTQLLKNKPKVFLSIRPSINFIGTRAQFTACKDSTEARDSGFAVGEEMKRSGDGGGPGNNWTTSILLFGLWAVLMFYVFRLAPDQTPYRDVYFIQKLLYLKGDDAYRMNEVLVALWNIMGLWPMIYSMLLLPTGRSSRSKVPVWPFLFLSIFGGAYALIPYFVLWKPPPPAIGEDEIRKWPLNFLESRISASVVLAAGLSLVAYALFANGDVWTEFYQYFRESKFIHVMSLDFVLLSSFAPFWIYNDMTSRRWVDKGLWLLFLSVIPLLGPALYVLLRPRLAELPTRFFPDPDSIETD
ncbi:uncharacterized protein LOC110038492 [Phalaenopsis equestris]|uniref:uncharacterized protein LOC110038492 n=1 Tax=Phalaenopsis equestris TaxID=78828 RepID=UPI0009E5185F|nr:uncharacterized protein LOC110038492 [Phalaenopsis equestris]